MAYKTYTEQLQEHLKTLNDNGLSVSELKLDSSNWIRCHGHEETRGRGEYSYISNTEKLSNGLLGLSTSFRGINGAGSFRTYGNWPSDSEEKIQLPPLGGRKSISQIHEQAARKAYGFWKHSNLSGSSDYLMRKGVGAYGIRFRSEEKYGNVAVVPMFDKHGKLWSYQLLNPNGTKRHPKACRTEGLFHRLGNLQNGEPIGIAEGYVTAATCLELIKFPTVAAFSAENMVSVTQAVLSLFPASLIILFADNDQHLVDQGKPNKGYLNAQEAKKLAEDRIVLAIPHFCDLKPSKEASDWNDFVRINGRTKAKQEIDRILAN